MTTAERLYVLARLYQEGSVSELMDRTLEKLLRHEADRCRAQLAQLQTDLAAFEQRYEQRSGEFYQQFQAGQTDDRMDYMEWASLVQMSDNLEKRLQLLQSEPSL
jgi:hypothetical protein